MSTALKEKTKDGRFVTAFWLIVNVLFFLWFLTFTFVIGLLVLIPNYLLHRSWKPGRHALAIRWFITFYGRCVIRLSWPMIRFSVQDRELAKGAHPCVYVLNHLSFADVFFCSHMPHYNIIIAIRSWPFKIPIFNIFMKIAGYMDVEKTLWDEMLTYSAESIKSGTSLLFFSEGHRSKDGQLYPLGKGAFRIAADNNVPIVPVALIGTESLGGYKSSTVRPCRVKMRFFAPVWAEDNSFAGVNDLRQRVEDLFQQEVYKKRTNSVKD